MKWWFSGGGVVTGEVVVQWRGTGGVVTGEVEGDRWSGGSVEGDR